MRPLKRAAMVGGEGLAGPSSVADAAPAANPVDDAASDANRADALTKLEALFVAGVLTEEQYSSERDRLTEGI